MTIPIERASHAFLRKTIRFHEALVAHALRLEAGGQDEKALRWISVTAELAWAAHPGRLSDERLEAAAIRIGRRLGSKPDGFRPDDVGRTGREAKRRVLHVATLVLGTGGHTRLLENWVKTDHASEHSLLLINQAQEPIRTALSDRIKASGGRLIAIPHDTPLLDRARRLRDAAQSGFDLVVMHHHPFDVVPLVAFAVEGGPPVAVMNHADHVFWLGVSVADIVVHFREFGAALSQERRGIRRSFLVPLPLDINVATPSRMESRARLNIPDDELMLLTIGSAAKYLPTERHRFFETALKVLDRHPKARLYVVGIAEKEARVLSIPRHDRIVLLGVIPDPTDYKAAADLYLEGYPFGSYTAMLEAAAWGVFPMAMHSPTGHNDVTSEAAFRELTSSARSEADYVAGISALLDQPDDRRQRGRMIAQRIVDHHGAEASQRYLAQFYSVVDTLQHSVEPLPDQPHQVNRHDLDLASFQGLRSAIPLAEWISSKTLLTLSPRELVQLFRISRRVGDTRLAPRHAKAWLSMLKRKLLRTLE